MSTRLGNLFVSRAEHRPGCGAAYRSGSNPLRCGACCALPREFRAGRDGRAEHDVSSWAERVATTEPPPLRSLLHQLRNGMRVIEDRSGCQLTPRMVHTLELRPSSVYRQFGAGREGRIEREEEDGLGDLVRHPQRFMGTIPIIFSLICAAASPGNALPMIGVSMGPGDTALTRISRGISSVASVRANDLSAALRLRMWRCRASP